MNATSIYNRDAVGFCDVWTSRRYPYIKTEFKKFIPEDIHGFALGFLALFNTTFALRRYLLQHKTFGPMVKITIASMSMVGFATALHFVGARLVKSTSWTLYIGLNFGMNVSTVAINYLCSNFVNHFHIGCGVGWKYTCMVIHAISFLCCFGPPKFATPIVQSIYILMIPYPKTFKHISIEFVLDFMMYFLASGWLVYELIFPCGQYPKHSITDSFQLIQFAVRQAHLEYVCVKKAKEEKKNMKND